MKVSALALAAVCVAVSANAQQNAAGKPNILVVFGDDIGISNISAYSDGLMGYETPNIDRIAKEDIWYREYQQRSEERARSVLLRR